MSPHSDLRPRYLLPLVGVAAALAVVAWLLLAGGEDQDAAPVQVDGRPRGEVGASDPVRGDESGAIPGSAGIDVVVLATLAPPAPRAARLVDRGVAVDETVEVVAGPGTADPASRSGPHLLRFTLVDGSRLLRVARLSPNATTDVPRLAPRRLAGRVADADGRPLEGEVVWAGQWWNDGQRIEVVTDVEGRFEFDAVPTGPGVVVIAVGGERHAPAWRLVDPTPDAPVDGLVITLRPRAELAVNLLAQVEAAQLGRVWLRPADAATATTSFPYFLAGLERDQGFALDASGEASVPVPGGEASVDVVVAHPDLLLADRRGVRLGGRDRPRARVTPDAGEALTITVRDLAGEPCGGVLVELGPVGGAAVRASGALLPHAGHTGAWSFGTSGADGRVVLRRIPGRPAELAVRSAVTSFWDVPARVPEFDVFAVAAGDVAAGGAAAAPELIVDVAGGNRPRVHAPGGSGHDLEAGTLRTIQLDRPALLELRQVDADGAARLVARVPVLGARRFTLPE